MFTNSDGVLSLFVRNGKDQVQLIISSAATSCSPVLLTSSREYFFVSGKKSKTVGKMMTAFSAAKKAYVPQPILENMGPVTMTCVSGDQLWPLEILERGVLTTKKLKSQLEAVDRALAGARILNGVTSAGYSQVIPSQPMENHVLNKNSMRTEKICATLDVSSYKPARMAMVPACKTVVQSIRGRRPSLSMMKSATKLGDVSLLHDKLPGGNHSRGEEVTCAVDSSDDSRHFRVETHVF